MILWVRSVWKNKSRIFSPAVVVAMILLLSSHALLSPDAEHSTGWSQSGSIFHSGSRRYCEITWPAREFPIEVEMTNSLYQGFIINLEWAIRSNSDSSAQIKRCFVCKRIGVLNKKWRNYSHFCLLKTEVSAGWGCRENTHFTEWLTVLCLEKRDSAALRTNFFMHELQLKG